MRFDVLVLIAGIVIGATVTIFMEPPPIIRGDCSLYRVKQETKTAYVLKPPPAPEPIVVQAKCPAPPEPVEPVVEEKPKIRHMRRRRH